MIRLHFVLVRALALCVAVGIFVDLARADEQGDLRAIVKKAVDAQGGEAKLAKKPAITTKETGTFSGMGAAVPFTGTISMHLPNRMRMEIKDVFTMVVDGDKGWISTMGMVQDMTKEQIDEQMAVLRCDWVATLLPLVKGTDFQLAALGESTIDGKSAVGVRASRKDYRDVSLYFDKKSGLLVKCEYIVKADELGGKEVTQEALFSQYEDVDGIKMAKKVVTRRDGQAFVESSVEDVRREEKLDDSLFARP
jgi:outer membrane lipoprotein-sorting protein